MSSDDTTQKVKKAASSNGDKVSDNAGKIQKQGKCTASIDDPRRVAFRQIAHCGDRAHRRQGKIGSREGDKSEQGSEAAQDTGSLE